MKKRILVLLCFLSTLSAATVYASDLDDGISKATDDSINADDQLGQRDRNVSYIKRKAISDSDVRSRKGIEQGKSAGSIAGSSSTPGMGNMNSVVLGPGGNVRGDIIIIDQSRGDKTQVVDK